MNIHEDAPTLAAARRKANGLSFLAFFLVFFLSFFLVLL